MAQSSVEVGRPTLQVRGRVPTNDKFVGAKIVYEDALGNDGVIWFTETTIPTDGSLTEVTAGEGLPKGAIIKEGEVFLVQATSAPLQRGACAVRLSAGDHTITAGYLWQGRWAVDMLNPEVLGPAGGHGNNRSISVANPAAETDLSILATVPADAIWRPLGFGGFSLVTSADAANRRVRLEIEDGTNVYATSVAGGLQAASITARYHSCRRGTANYSNNTSIATDSDVELPMPEVFMQETHRIAVTTDNFDAVIAGDDWTGGTLAVEEWLVI